jgi:hypothetical protein
MDPLVACDCAYAAGAATTSASSTTAANKRLLNRNIFFSLTWFPAAQTVRVVETRPRLSLFQSSHHGPKDRQVDRRIIPQNVAKKIQTRLHAARRDSR